MYISNQEGFSALAVAANHGHLEAVRALLQHGAEVNLADPVRNDFKLDLPVMLHSVFNCIDDVMCEPSVTC